MTEAELEERIWAVIGTVSGASVPLGERLGNVELTQYGIDSLRLVAFACSLEEALEVEFPDNMMSSSTFRTLSSILAALASIAEPKE